MDIFSRVEKMFDVADTIVEFFKTLIYEPYNLAMEIIESLLVFTMAIISSVMGIATALYEEMLISPEFQVLLGFGVAVIIIMSGVRLYNKGIIDDQQDVGFYFFYDTLKNILFVLYGTKGFVFVLGAINKLVISVNDTFIADKQSAINSSVTGMSDAMQEVAINPILLLLFILLFTVVFATTLYDFMRNIASHTVSFLLIGFFVPFIGAVSVFNMEYTEKVKGFLIKKSSQLFIDLISINLFIFLISKLIKVYGILKSSLGLGSGLLWLTGDLPLLVFIMLFSVGYSESVSEIAEFIFGSTASSSAGKVVNGAKAMGKGLLAKFRK